MVRHELRMQCQDDRRLSYTGVSHGGNGVTVRGWGRVRLSSSMSGRAPCASPVTSQLKRCPLNRRGGSVQRLAAAAPVRRCYAPAERVDGTRTIHTPHTARFFVLDVNRFDSEPERHDR